MDAVIYEDTLQQQHNGDKHKLKHDWFAAHGVTVRRTRFDGKHDVPWSFGDYGTDGSNVVVDTKSSMAEVSTNLGRDHSRFKKEIQRANNDGCLLVVLIETDEVESIQDVITWVNSHCRHCFHYRGKRCNPENSDDICIKHGTKKPLQGETMAKQMTTMQINRGVRFEFVHPSESAKRICELLGVTCETDDS
jgi:hypothetical protein